MSDNVDEAVRAACEAYVGKTRVAEDSMGPEAAEKLATILNAPRPEDGLPPTWHWAYFTAAIPLGDVGHDGHEKLGLFMPAAPFDRRMWAGGEVEMLAPLSFGATATRRSTIEDVSFKTGATGALCFVKVGHEITQKGQTKLREVQTIVYRDRGPPEEALRGPSDPIPDGFSVYADTTLIAYSAVLQNGHRIHWDRAFCREVEGYPDLVVHGPLMATALADSLRDGLAPSRFTYRALAPVFQTSPIRIVPSDSAPGAAQMERSDGVISMKATLTPL